MEGGGMQFGRGVQLEEGEDLQVLQDPSGDEAGVDVQQHDRPRGGAYGDPGPASAGADGGPGPSKPKGAGNILHKETAKEANNVAKMAALARAKTRAGGTKPAKKKARGD